MAVLGISLSMLQYGVAHAAICFEPSAPSRYAKPVKPTLPSKPYCASAYSSNCAQWEIDAYNSKIRSYNSEIDNYNMQLESYIRKLKAYAADAQQYAICELKSLDD